MLLVIISLFSNYDLLSCVDCEKAKFDELLLMKMHHQNYVQIKDFIKEAHHKFHEESSVLRAGVNELDLTRDDAFLEHNITKWWGDNTSSIDQLGLNTQNTFLLPSIRSRPLFPIPITPYTTELNDRHLNWDEIFPALSIHTTPSEPKLLTGSDISNPPKNRSRSQAPQPKDQNTFGPMIQPPKLHIFSRPLNPNTTLGHNTSLRSHPGHDFGPNIALITPNEEYMKIWLREITTYTPVEGWFKTLTTQSGMSSSYDNTTKGAPKLGHTTTKASKAQTLVKVQPPRFLRQGLPLSVNLTEVKDYNWYLTASTVSAKTAQFFVDEVGGILDLRTVSEKDDKKTKMIGEKAATAPNAGEMKVTLTTADVLHTETPASSARKSRRFHSKARKRKRPHDLYKRYEASQLYQKHKDRHQEYSNEHIYRRRKNRLRGIQKVARLSENRRHRVQTEPPNALLQYSEDDDTEDEQLMKLIERSDESVSNIVQKDKTYFYNRVKESLLQAETKKKAKRMKLKAELLRKIVEGSSYSDEEASLTKNLIQALQYGNQTFEHDVARNNRDMMKRIIR